MNNPRTIVCVQEHDLEKGHAVFDVLYQNGFTRLWVLTPKEVNQEDVKAAELFVFVNRVDKEEVEKSIFLSWYKLDNAPGLRKNCIVLELGKYKTIEQLHESIKESFAAAGHSVGAES